MASPPDHSVRWLPEANGWRRFELTSRGDRIVARLLGPAGGGAPLAVVLAAEAAGVAPVEGCRTLTLDLPLLGERASPKWTERLRRVLSEGPVAAADGLLLSDFADQAVADVASALDVCAEPGAAGAGLLGIGPGAFAASAIAAREPRLRSFVIEPQGVALALDPAAAFRAGDRTCTVVADAAEGATRLREALR
jgi:hypothetical protein